MYDNKYRDLIEWNHFYHIVFEEMGTLYESYVKVIH